MYVFISPNALGAFADDIGAVIYDISFTLPSLVALFDVFASVSNLRLNVGKCCCIPLCDASASEAFVAKFAELAPTWSEIAIQDHAEYLGFVLGPGACINMWSNVVAKALDTVSRWKKIAAGFFFNVIASNIFILSLFSFVGQLACPDSSVGDCITTMRNSLFSGPGNWLPPCLLNNLKELGFPVQARDPFAAMLASKVRIALTSQLDIDTMSTELGLRRISWQRLHDKSHPHWDWHHNTFVFNVVCARNDFRDMIEGSSDALSIQDVRSMCVEKQGGQKIIYTMMKRSDSPVPAAIVFNKMRHRLDRWKHLFAIPIGHVNQRLENRFSMLGGVAKPSLIAVYLRTMLNGWITERRMRGISTTLRETCPFCKRARDSLEHFAFCPVVTDLYQQHGIQLAPPNNFLQFLGLMKEDNGPRIFTIVKLLSVLYSTHNTLRHNPDLEPKDIIRIAVYALF